MSYYYIFNYFKTYTIEEVAILLGVDMKKMQKLIDSGHFKIIRITEKIIRISPWSLEIGAHGHQANDRRIIMDFLDELFYEAHWTYDLDELCHILGVDKEVTLSLLRSGVIPYKEDDSAIIISPNDLYRYLRYYEEFNPRRAWYENPKEESGDYEFYFDDYDPDDKEDFFDENEYPLDEEINIDIDERFDEDDEII